MFGRFKKKTETEEPELAKIAEELKAEVTEKQEVADTPGKKVKRTIESSKEKPAKMAEDTSTNNPQVHVFLRGTERPFVGIKEYNSALEISEKIDGEMDETKSALGVYLRQLDDKRAIAEKAKRLHEVVAKMANRKVTRESSNQIEVNGLEIVLDATAVNELTAIENVVKSHQQRLMALQQAREALKTLDQVGDTEGIKYLTLEREGIPEQILLKLS